MGNVHSWHIYRGWGGVHNSGVKFEMQTGQLPVNSTNPLLCMAPKDPSRIIPPILHGPNGWKQVVWDWEHPDPSRVLKFALKDWEPSWFSGSRATSLPSGSLYSQRRLITTEFIQKWVIEPSINIFVHNFPFRFDQNEARFTEAYPEHEWGVTALLKAIRKAGIVNKTIIPRKHKTFNEDN